MADDEYRDVPTDPGYQRTHTDRLIMRLQGDLGAFIAHVGDQLEHNAEDHARLTATLDKCGEAIERVTERIVGNGRKGIVTKLAELETAHRIKWSIASAMGGAGLALAIWALKAVLTAKGG